MRERVMKRFRMFSRQLSRIQYRIVNYIIMLYVIVSEPILLITENLDPLTYILLVLHPPASGNSHSILCEIKDFHSNGLKLYYMPTIVFLFKLVRLPA